MNKFQKTKKSKKHYTEEMFFTKLQKIEIEIFAFLVINFEQNKI